MRPVRISKVLVAASANNISLSQTPGAAGNLLLNGSTAGTLDTARVVGITSAADDSGRTFTIYGTNAHGFAISEAVAGANTGVASSVGNFLTVTRIAVDAATAGAVTVGTTGVGAAAWIPVDSTQAVFAIGFGCVVTGTVNYTIQHTFDDVFDPTVTPTAFPHAVVAAKTANSDGNYAFPVRAVRLKINSGAGSVVATFVQGLES